MQRLPHPRPATLRPIALSFRVLDRQCTDGIVQTFLCESLKNLKMLNQSNYVWRQKYVC